MDTNNETTIQRNASIALITQELEVDFVVAEVFMEKLDLLYHIGNIPFYEINSILSSETEEFDSDGTPFWRWKMRAEADKIVYHMGGRLFSNKQSITISVIETDGKSLYPTFINIDYIKVDGTRENSIDYVSAALNIPNELARVFMEKLDILQGACCIGFSDVLQVQATQTVDNGTIYDLAVSAYEGEDYNIKVELHENKIIILEVANSSGEILYSADM